MHQNQSIALYSSFSIYGVIQKEERKFRAKIGESFHKAHILEEEAEKQILKQQMIFERQNKEITV